ncbi:MAG TPA: OmpH family outer membrane protein [Caulobacteraceae bacterium]|nr:OmpH family outer membrane protein [Caulobacteraceae bacterium]
MFSFSHRATLAGGAALALALATSGAIAQSRAAAQPRATTAATPAPVIAQGPVIPGVCTISVNQAISESQVGQFVRTRLQQLGQQVSAELSPEDTSISNDAKAYQAKAATLDATSRQSQGQALQARANAFQQKYELRQREMQATQEKALNRIAQELDPIAQQLYQQHRCSILINRNAVLIGNPDMDLTSAAVTQLNGKLQQFAFDREHLDTAPAPAAR